MRRYFVLLLCILIIACEGENTTGGVVGDQLEKLKDVGLHDAKDSLARGSRITGMVVEATKSEEDLLRELENQQRDIMLERADLIKQKREVLDKIISRETSFEDKQFYQKAFNVLKAKESELNVGIKRLETRIKSLQGKDENKETIEALENAIKDLDEKKDDYLKKIDELGEKIVQTRKDWLNLDLTLDQIEDFRDSLSGMEIEEDNLIDQSIELIAELKDKKDRLAELTGDVFRGDDDTLIAERSRIEEEIDVVNNEMVTLFLASKDATGKELEDIKKRIDDLDEIEEDLNIQLFEVNKKIGS